MKSQTALSIALELYVIFCLFGPPRILQNDRAPNLNEEVIVELCKLMSVGHRTTTAYYPQSDGKVENTIKNVVAIIYKYIQGSNNLWPQVCYVAQLWYNDHIAHRTGSSPFSLMFGRMLNEFKDYSAPGSPTITVRDVEQWKAFQKKLIELIYPSLVNRSNKLQQQYLDRMDSHRRRLINNDLPEGTEVYILDPKYIKAPHTRPQRQPRYLDTLFTIVRRHPGGAYVLKNELGVVLDRNVPISHIA